MLQRLAPALLAVAIITVSAWSLTFADRVGELRGELEVRVGWLIELREVDRRMLEEAELLSAPDRLRRLARQTRDERPELAERFEAIAALTADHPVEAMAASGRLVDEIRDENGQISAELGQLVDHLGLLALATLALGLLAVGLLAWGSIRSRRASFEIGRAEALEAQLDFLVSASPAVLYTAQPRPPYGITFVSRNVATVFGHVGDVVSARLWLEPDKRAAALKVASDAARNGRAVAEYGVLGPSGHRLGIRDECRRSSEDEGAVLVGCLTDVTDRHLAEDAVRRALADTERAVAAAVRERDFMVSAASHDLREPVRKIAVFAELLQGELGEDLAPESAEYLRFLVDASRRMQDLVRDLLEYGRVDSESTPFDTVDTDQLVRDVLDDLALRIDESGAQIEVDELPPLHGDRGQLARVFLNLIDNALTYAKEGEAPRIRIKARPEGEFVEIDVRDQGIGFDPLFAERILQPFQRLHVGGERSGTGIGLAICRKIVERHGGTIVPQGLPGEGAIFTLRLPVPPVVE